MIKLYFFALLSLILKINRVEAKTISVDPDSIYQQQAKIFINDIYAEKLKSKRSVLINEPQFYRHGLEDSDTSFFDTKELSYIKKQIQEPELKSWRNLISTQMNCISKDSLNRILKKEYFRLYNGWDYFYRYVGKDIHIFSSPIFIKNYQYCLFYTEISCGLGCASGETFLYRKKNGKWAKFKLIYSWIS